MNRSDGGSRPPAVLLASLVVLLVAGAACGSDPDGAASDESPTGPDPSTASSPFTVGPPPDGYRLVAAGRGTGVQEWGSDSFGSDEPYTVLSPDGTATSDDVVVVALTGYDGYQGGLAQASTGYLSAGREAFTHDGQDALFVPAGHQPDGSGWADLVVTRDQSVAVRVTTPDGTRDELLAIADGVRVPEAEGDVKGSVVDAPEVDVSGLEVVGAVDADGVVALRSYAQRSSDQVPGPAVAHGAGWVGSADVGFVVVATLPGRSLDVTALGVSGWSPVDLSGETVARLTEVEGRAAAVLAHTRDEESGGQVERVVAVEAPWGDVVVVRSSWGRPVSEADLLELAASVEQTDEATWDAFVTEAAGGPGLHPDEGRVEVARGSVGKIEWLLQDGPATGGILATEPDDDPDLSQIDTCLKLSDRTRTCADAVQTGPNGTVSTIDDDAVNGNGDTSIGDVAIVSTTQEGDSLRATTATGQVTAPLVQVPGRELRAAVVVLDEVGSVRCEGDPATPPPPGSMRLDILDAEGQAIACIG